MKMRASTNGAIHDSYLRGKAVHSLNRITDQRFGVQVNLRSATVPSLTWEEYPVRADILQVQLPQTYSTGMALLL